MEIIACPNCGSRRIYQGTMGEGVLTGYTTRNVCKNCGYQGMPIIFDSEKDYQKFLIGKSKDKKSSKIKKEVTKKEGKKQKIKRPIGIFYLVTTIILIALFEILIYFTYFEFYMTNLLWIYYLVVFVISAIILPYGLIRGSGWAWTFSGILFAMSIPIGLIFLYYITRPHVKAFFGKD
jgi:DNA-directed RNA polymerase subunit RPC12/RpoP